MIEPEKDTGNVEYKLKLLDRTTEQVEHIASQMRYRCEEGDGECIYNLGVSDNGMLVGITDSEYEETIKVLNTAAEKSKYVLTLLTKSSIDKDKSVYEVLIRENNIGEYIDIKVAIAGQVDSSKSSTLGVLITGKNDNGRGSARLAVFNYKHEVISGRTSSIGHHILGFDANGSIVNHKMLLNKPSWSDIVQSSKKIVTFFDLAGHSKYLHTTILGLTSTLPDLCLIMISANSGVADDQDQVATKKFNRIENMTKEHIFLCIALKIPFAILVTKVDMMKNRENVLKDTLDQINKLLSLPGIRRIPISVITDEDVITCAKQVHTESITPIIQTSNVTGQGLDKLTKFLNLLPKTTRPILTDNVEYLIDSIWVVPGVGTVVGGNLRSGAVAIGDKLWLGPNNDKYEQVSIKSIHCKRVSVTSVQHGSYVCIALKKIQRNSIRRGNVLVSKPSQFIVAKTFVADVRIMRSHSTTIRVNYEPIVHALAMRQTASLVKIENKCNIRDPNQTTGDGVLRTGDTAIVTFKFLKDSEYLPVGTRILLCESMTKIIGVVKSTN